mmetsp:Transcript_74991/g.206825  ORF Transcript_74991/g.206825 Transcript_74991/m.206825 type:complete len:211 (+) Transcript_74991:134-766(+)
MAAAHTTVPKLGLELRFRVKVLWWLAAVNHEDGRPRHLLPKLRRRRLRRGAPVLGPLIERHNAQHLVQHAMTQLISVRLVVLQEQLDRPGTLLARMLVHLLQLPKRLGIAARPGRLRLGRRVGRPVKVVGHRAILRLAHIARTIHFDEPAQRERAHQGAVAALLLLQEDGPELDQQGTQLVDGLLGRQYDGSFLRWRRTLCCRRPTLSHG